MTKAYKINVNRCKCGVNNISFRYTDKTELLDIISFLDPRTKSLPYISAEEREIIHDKLLDTLVNYETSRDGSGTHDSANTGTGSNNSAEVGKAQTKDRLTNLLGSMYGTVSKPQSGSSMKKNMSQEVKNYIAADSAFMKDCPLSW